jgi:hypothetical protein
MTLRRCSLVALALIALAPHGRAQQIPSTSIDTLSGGHVVVPVPASTKPLIVLISFSHKGGDDAEAWNKLFKVPYETDHRVDYCELADFQGVPSLIMKMILHGMRREVHEPEKSHLGLLYAHEEDWKKLVSYQSPDVTYVLVASPDGRVVWQTHGPATAAKAAQLEDTVNGLASHRP